MHVCLEREGGREEGERVIERWGEEEKEKEGEEPEKQEHHSFLAL